MITDQTMSVASRGVRGGMASASAAAGMRRYRDRDTSPERTKVWVEPKSKAERKDVMVPVVYYLTRNGQLEHPHFMEVPLSSSDGLFLRDMMNQLNFLRGKGMANMYAWSSKRSYKSGFVWHDLSENDLVHPAQGQEYVLKGSELPLQSPPAASSADSQSSISSFPDHQPPATAEKPGTVGGRRRNQSWSNLDLAEYKIDKTSPAADASTQTDDKSRRRRRPAGRPGGQPEPNDPDKKEAVGAAEIEETELTRDEISQPPSSSSPETLEALIKAVRRLVLPAVDGGADICDRTAREGPSGRMTASTVLMQLISCGSISVKDHGLSLITHYKERVSRVSGLDIGSVSECLSKAAESVTARAGLGGVGLEDKEYFSGSLIEANKGLSVEAIPGLKRSSSYNADRSSMPDLIEEVGEDSRHTIKCIPRKLRSAARSKLNDISSSISRSTHGSKRIFEEDLKL